MKDIRFAFMDKTRKEECLPQLFDILYHNMEEIVPWGADYEKEKVSWLAAVGPAMEKPPRQIILMLAGEKLAGFFQYYVSGSTFMIEEVQIVPEYQGTTALLTLMRHLTDVLPEGIETVAAYSHRLNLKSQRIIRKLGLEQQEENSSGDYLLYLGDFPSVMARFGKKK